MYKLNYGKKKKLSKKIKHLNKNLEEAQGEPSKWLTYSIAILNKLSASGIVDSIALMREIAPGEKILDFNCQLYSKIFDHLESKGLIHELHSIKGCNGS